MKKNNPKNNKKMNTQNYPNWLVPLDIAQELKAIGFDEPCHFYYQNDYSEYLKAGDPDKYHIISDSLAANRKNANHNISEIAISAPTWEQVFQWFREKGFNGWIEYQTLYEKYIPKLAVREEFIYIKKNRGYKTYNEAREFLVKALIRTYKQEQL